MATTTKKAAKKAEETTTGQKSGNNPSEEKAAQPPSREQIYELAQALLALTPEVPEQDDPGDDLFLYYDVQVQCGAYTQRICSTATLHDVMESGNEPDAIEAFDSLLRRVFTPLVNKFRREIVRNVEGNEFPRLGLKED